MGISQCFVSASDFLHYESHWSREHSMCKLSIFNSFQHLQCCTHSQTSVYFFFRFWNAQEHCWCLIKYDPVSQLIPAYMPSDWNSFDSFIIPTQSWLEETAVMLQVEYARLNQWKKQGEGSWQMEVKRKNCKSCLTRMCRFWGRERMLGARPSSQRLKARKMGGQEHDNLVQNLVASSMLVSSFQADWCSRSWSHWAASLINLHSGSLAPTSS